MASEPWSILQGARGGPTIFDLFMGAKQRRLDELYRQKTMDRQDRQDQREEEERAAVAAAITPSESSAAADQKKREGSKFARLSQLAGVGTDTAAPLSIPSAPAASAEASPPPSNFITPQQAQMMKSSMGEAGYRAWQQKHGVTEYNPEAARSSVQPGAGIAPPVANPSESAGGIGTRPAVADTGQPENLVPSAAGFYDGAAPASPGSSILSLNPQGLQRLARANPKLAFELSKMSSEQHSAAYKAIRDQVDLEGQIIGAVRAAPPAEQPRVYASIREELTAKGVNGLPEQWDPTLAETHQRMGLTAMQAFQDNRAERRLQQDVTDDQADNARADRNTDSVIEDRGARRGLVARGQDLTDTRGRRGQDIASGDRRRGQDLGSADSRYATDNRGRKNGAPVIHDVKTPAQASALPSGSYFRTPDGKVKVRP